MPHDADRAAPADRAQTASLLIEATEMTLADIAFAAGFTDVGELTRSVPGIGAAPPARAPGSAAAGITLALRLPVQLPFAYGGVFGHLAAGMVPGCEEVRNGVYRRTLRLPHGVGVVGLQPHADHVTCTLHLADRRDVSPAVARCRRLVDLDADPRPVIEALTADPALRAAVRRAPGQRIPGTVDPEELAVRVVLSQQVSLKAAATHAARLVAAHGDPITDPDGGLTHLFPTPAQLADLDPEQLALPRSRRATLVTLVTQLAAGTIDLGAGCDRDRARTQLLALPGVGPWTVEVIAMRGLGDPDAFPATDLGLRAAAAELGLPVGARALAAHANAWRPWRSYATQQLWASLDHAVNHWPPKERT